jgi:hypothetical protein
MEAVGPPPTKGSPTVAAEASAAEQARLWQLVEAGQWSDAGVEAHLPCIGEMARCDHGNFVLQLLLALGTTQQLEAVAAQLQGRAVELARHSVGCRVLSRVVEQCYQEPAACALLTELSPRLRELSTHAYGNFVVQKLVEYASSLPGVDLLLDDCVEGALVCHEHQRWAVWRRKAVVLRALEVGLVVGKRRARLLQNSDFEVACRHPVSGRIFRKAAAAEADEAKEADEAEKMPRDGGGWEHYCYMPQWLPSVYAGHPPLLVYSPHRVLLCETSKVLVWKVETRQLRLFHAGNFTLHLRLTEACGSLFSLEIFPVALDRRARPGVDGDLQLRLVLKRTSRPGDCDAWSSFLVGLEENSLRKHDFAACHLCLLEPWALAADVEEASVELSVIVRASPKEG